MATTTDRAETVVLTHVCLKCNQALPTPPERVFDSFASPNPEPFIATYMRGDTRILFHTVTKVSPPSAPDACFKWTRCGPVVPAVIVDSVNALEPDAVEGLVRGACERAFGAERGEALYNRFVTITGLVATGRHADLAAMGRMYRQGVSLNPDGNERYTEYVCNTCSCLFRYGELPPTAEGGGMVFVGLGDPHVDPPRPSAMQHFCPHGGVSFVVDVPQGTRCGAPGPNVPPCRRHLHHTGSHVTLVNGRELRQWTDVPEAAEEPEAQIEWWYRRGSRAFNETRAHAFRRVEGIMLARALCGMVRTSRWLPGRASIPTCRHCQRALATNPVSDDGGSTPGN